MLQTITVTKIISSKLWANTSYQKQTPLELLFPVENLTLNRIDKQGGLPWKETAYRNAVVDLMGELNFIDIYRHLHPRTKSFTYELKSSKLKSRIDFFLVSRSISVDVLKAEVCTSIAPDHKSIFLCIEIKSEFTRGPGLWKFNSLWIGSAVGMG